MDGSCKLQTWMTTMGKVICDGLSNWIWVIAQKLK